MCSPRLETETKFNMVAVIVLPKDVVIWELKYISRSSKLMLAKQWPRGNKLILIQVQMWSSLL